MAMMAGTWYILGIIPGTAHSALTGSHENFTESCFHVVRGFTAT